jgi:hypothetical protein
VTDGKIFIAQIMFFSHKKSQNVKISNKKKSFFSSRNQYFPHIPFVARKNEFRAKKIRLSRGVAVRLLVEICIDDISTVLRATDLRFRLSFVS